MTQLNNKVNSELEANESSGEISYQLSDSSRLLNDDNFKRDLIKIVVDKLLVALILVVVGFFATNLIERFKTERSFSAELSKMRVEKISQVWEKIYQLEAAYDESDRMTKDYYISAKTKSPEDDKALYQRLIMDPLIKSVGPLQIELEQLLIKNRFWLGEEMYEEIYYYLNASGEYRVAREGYLPPDRRPDEKGLQELLEKREKARASIIEIRNRLLQQ
jgi:hypothetical protein